MPEEFKITPQRMGIFMSMLAVLGMVWTYAQQQADIRSDITVLERDSASLQAEINALTAELKETNMAMIQLQIQLNRVLVELERGGG